jgi:hypothetical protein
LALLCIFCAPQASALPNVDIVFVGQIPNPTDFATANATFGNHLATVESIIRGGGLFVRYRNGTVKNLTRAAGFGNSGFQGANSIAVRDPSVSWDGQKVIFSMVVGAPTEQYEEGPSFWQLYEITGLGQSETPVITKVPNQPENFNNVSPIYGTDDTIFFTTDRPRNGARHLYPQRDEYESQPTVTGIWNLNPATGALRLLDHAPSGAFEPQIDSFGRIVYARWDHMQRDQQADENTDQMAFNFASEAADAARSNAPSEVFPEPRIQQQITEPRVNVHFFNHFFPWQINEDGTGHETINHIGRHELHGYFDRSFNDDDNLVEHFEPDINAGQHEIENFLQIAEDPLHPGLYFGIDAPEFRTHAAGQVITLFGAPSRKADQMSLSYLTDRSTAALDPDNIAPQHSGFYRDPLPLSDGSIVVSHTTAKVADENIGSDAAPQSRYAFRLKSLTQSDGSWVAGQALTPGIQASVSYFTPDIAASYSGPLWELQPVELTSRTRPAPNVSHPESPELGIFSDLGVDIDSFKASMAQRNLALIVMRNVTSRDKADLQQPFNLRVANGTAQSIKVPGKDYFVSYLQLFQGDQIRGYGGAATPEPGRRVIAQYLHDAMNGNPTVSGSPASSVEIAADGSVAALVPARRALTWQLTDPNGSSVVRERYWLTFQPGEVRVCAGCHGANSTDQLGRPSPTNPPEALRALLRYLKDHPLPDNTEVPIGSKPPKRYTLQASGPAGGRIRARARAQLAIRIEGATGVEQLQLLLAVNGRSCPSPLRSIRTSARGSKTLSGTAPTLRRRSADLFFSLRSHGSTVASTQTSLVQGKVNRQSMAPLTKRELRAVCDQFRKFR